MGTISCVDIILSTNVPLTNETFAKYLYNNGYRTAERCKPYNFFGSLFSVNSATKLRGTFGIYSSGETANTLATARMDLDIVVGTGFSSISTNTFAYTSTITDVVTEL